MNEDKLNFQIDEWEEIGGGGDGTFTEKEAWLPEKKGDTIQGQWTDEYLIKKGTRKEKKVYVITDEKGVEWSVFGGAVLNNKFNEIEKGDFVKIIYQGMKEGKEFEYRDYTFFRRRGEPKITEEPILE